MTVLTPNTGGFVTDSAGNRWTLTKAGGIEKNGDPVLFGDNTAELTVVSGDIWGQDAATKQWWAWNGTSWTAQGAGTPANPTPILTAALAAAPILTPAPTAIPTTPAPTAAPMPPISTPTSARPPSPDNTVIQAGSSASITDAAGNTWAITASSQIAINGVTDTTTKGVVAIAYEKGLIWQENTAHLWWFKTTPSWPWSPTGGTATSPVPGAPAPTSTPTPTPAPTPTPTPIPTPSPTPTPAPGGITLASLQAQVNSLQSQYTTLAAVVAKLQANPFGG